VQLARLPTRKDLARIALQVVRLAEGRFHIPSRLHAGFMVRDREPVFVGWPFSQFVYYLLLG
jgi:hypothetical protein